MSDLSYPQQLHDRATRGLPLSEQENADLQQWYAEQDKVEMELLMGKTSTAVPGLQARIDSALLQVQTVTQRIQTLTAENETLRREIAALTQRAAQSKVVQVA